ncbi:hypothetical protein TNCV_719271 [Trichonephila clavipes]|nr:hypothetical protein TNCV_719271 [Trichonephila clavipes]
MSSSLVPLKTSGVGKQCTLNLSRGQTSSRWCDVEVSRGGANSGVVLVTSLWFKITRSVAKSPLLADQNSNLGHHTGQANAVRGINADQIRCCQLASLDKNNALREIKLRLSYLQGKSTTMSVIAHQTEKEWISANEKIRQRMSQTHAEGAAKQHAARLEEAHLRAHHSCFTTSERC